MQQTSQISLKTIGEPIVSTPDDDLSIRSLRAFPRGFTFGYRTGLVHLFEMETPHKFIKRNTFRIPDHSIIREYEEESKEKMTTINHISVSPSQAKLMVTCQESQIYFVNLWMQESSEKNDDDQKDNSTLMMETPFMEYGAKLHNGPIGSIAVCCWKPILLTSGTYNLYKKKNWENTLQNEKSHLMMYQDIG